MNCTEKITITKIDAAHRQLCTAIELWFFNGDPVSIHSLACAAHQIVHDLNRRKKGPELLFDSIFIKDEYRREFIGFVKKEAAFFKHADRGRTGSAKSVDFDPRSSEIFILMTVMGLRFLGEPLNDAETAFLWWSYLHKPRWLKDGVHRKFIESVPVDLIAYIRGNKREFFDEFIEERRNATSR